jgi:hypothetical protein
MNLLEDLPDTELILLALIFIWFKLDSILDELRAWRRGEEIDDSDTWVGRLIWVVLAVALLFGSSVLQWLQGLWGS